MLQPRRRILKPIIAASRLLFSTSSRVSSHIGSTAITIPPYVEFSLPNSPHRSVSIEGPLGIMKVPIPHYMTVTKNGDKAILSVQNPSIKMQRQMWGTTRALIANHITGVTEGHVVVIKLVGIGYRASIERNGKVVSLRIGFSNPIEEPIPPGVKTTCSQPTRIVLEGPNKNAVTQFAATLRKWRPPEPYKGKGIFVGQETIKLKDVKKK
ncbi:54S ribosomal protein L6, mitochondrial [Neolecta irregularis DAH-3]|uniref:54S ribosomal protein L6, mitochondrial n=1 Tax=Neolecta irregularis (strain DAH-3) TaxID=1198029 RepID=A0A1U7LKB7_NEOID|nr:54S ribosomal protein L6, mitochondrial [Neolecta irregularis DAH-3]|eukprot:OLL23100.1 54S ribosomal protein L6, mitochondrial [Neolecta irregularis DAH-3]